MLYILDAKTSLSAEEKDRLQELLTALKLKLKAAAKRAPRNSYERFYFDPAVKQAAANLRITTNSHPIASDWYSALSGTQQNTTPSKAHKHSVEFLLRLGSFHRTDLGHVLKDVQAVVDIHPGFFQPGQPGRFIGRQALRGLAVCRKPSRPLFNALRVKRVASL